MDEAKRVVKIRLNASGKRVIGYVELLGHENRISDRLNDADTFFLLDTPETAESGAECLAIFKDAVSYVEALEEPERVHERREAGCFKWVTVELVEPPATLMGELFVPTDAKVTDCLNDPRRFINLKNVTFADSAEHYGYLALGKCQCRLWSILVNK